MQSKDQKDYPKKYRNFAFISYSRKDIKWAEWLQNKLETYHLPAKLLKENKQLPRMIKPICRDKTDFAGVILEDTIHVNLEESRYLIVICSPNSAASKYVNGEIDYFVSLGRTKNIIPFIVKGIPFAENPEEECFPASIRKIQPELLGVDVQDLGKRNAFLRLVSTLLHINHDDLVMRDKKRRRIRGIIGSTAALVAAFAGFCVIWYNTEHSKYYNAYTYRNEIPVGIYELSDKQRAASADCYRITTLRGKVIRLETVNSLGNVIDPVFVTDTTEYPAMEYIYDDSGSLVGVVQYDAEGSVVVRKSIAHVEGESMMIIDYRDSSNIDAVSLSSDMSASLTGSMEETTKSRINRQVNTYDEEGMLLQTMYYWYNTSYPASDSNGVYGKRFEYDERGQIIRITNLNEDGEIHNCKYGWSTLLYEYDETGTMIACQYLSADGEKVYCQEGYSSLQAVSDDAGNVLQMTYFNKNGQLSTNANGVAKQSFAYDDGGFLLEAENYDVQNIPVKDTYGVYEYQYGYDDNGYLQSIKYIGKMGSLTFVAALEAAEIRYERDATGKVLKEQRLDMHENVLYERKNTYTDGNLTAIKYYDGQGNLENTQQSDGYYHECRMEYDAKGNCIRQSYYLANGELNSIYDDYAIAEQDYDEFGNLVEIRYYDTERKLTCQTLGYASVCYEFEDGNLVSESFYGTEGERVEIQPAWWLSRTGYHQCLMEYDEKGNCVNLTYYDADGEVTTYSGSAIEKQEYDAHGNVISVKYYNSQGEPLTGAFDIHEKKYEYDEAGNLIFAAYYNADGEPVSGVAGHDEVYSILYENDESGNRIYEAHFGKGGELVYSGVFPWGYAVCKSEYDSYGNVISRKYYDVNLEPMMFMDSYYEECVEYDEKGNEISRKFYDTEGGLVMRYGAYAYYIQEYDEYGNVISERIYDTENQPMMYEEWNYHEFRMEYDNYGYVIATSYYDTERQPVLYRGLMAGKTYPYHSHHREYNGRGRIIREWYCDTEGEPTLYYGYHECRYEYDKWGNRIRESYYGVDGEPVLNDGDSQYHAEVTIYDEAGEYIIGREFYDANGEPGLTYDEGEEIYYPIYLPEYDDKGNLISSKCYDADGNPTVSEFGEHERRHEYDEDGNEISEKVYDIDGNPVMITGYHSGSWHSATSEYDEEGRIIRSWYGDIEGNRTMCDGICETVWVYDRDGDLIEMIRYDVEGNVVEK